MDVRTPTWLGVWTLLWWSAVLPVWADQAADQYSVAAAHYAAHRWDLAATEFRTLLDRHPQSPRTDEARYFLGECLVQSGKYREAAETLGVLLTDQPDAKLARLALFRQGEAWHLAGEPKSAEPALRQFLRLYHDDPSANHARYYHGASLLALAQPAEAAEQFDQALRRGAGGTLAEMCRLGQGQSAEHLKKDAEAAEHYQQLLAAKNPKLAQQARLRLGTLQFRRGQFASAVETLQPLSALPPDDPQRDEARYWTALSLLQAGLHQPALEILLPWTVQSTPRADEARFRAGMALIALGGESPSRATEARALLEQVSPEGPWGSAALVGRIQIAIAQNDSTRVEQLHQEFSRRYPQDVRTSEVAELVARHLAQSGKHKDAVQLLQSRLGSGRNDDDTDRRRRYLLALSHVGLNQPADAMRQLELVLQADDRDLKRRAFQSQGAILVSQGRYQEAIAPFMASLELTPGEADAALCRSQLAICYARTGRLADARKLDQELEQSTVDAARATHLMALAEAAVAVGEVAWAERLWQRVAHTDVPSSKSAVPSAQSAQALYLLARSQLLTERPTESIATCQQLLAREPAELLAAQCWILRAAALEKLGRNEEALQSYRQVFDRRESPLATVPLATAALVTAALAKAAQLEQSLGHPEEAIRLYRRLAEQFPQAIETDAALYQLAWLLQAAQRDEESLACFSKLHHQYPGSRYWADATYRLAAAALKAGQADAVRCLVTSLVEADQAPPEVLAHGLLLDIQRSVAENNWPSVERSANHLLQRAPQSKLAPVAQFWLAEAAYRQQHRDEAVQRFTELEARRLVGQDAWQAMIPLRLGQLAAAARDWPTARQRVEQVRRDWPSGDHLQELDYLAGRCLAAEARFDEARQAYTRVIEAPAQDKTETAAMAQWMIGETYLHQQRYADALREYLRVEVLYAYPRWQAAALLEAGRCYEALGRSADAAATYQRILDHYGDTHFSAEAQKRLQHRSAAELAPANHSAAKSATGVLPVSPSAPREAAVPSHSSGRNSPR